MTSLLENCILGQTIALVKLIRVQPFSTCSTRVQSELNRFPLIVHTIRLSVSLLPHSYELLVLQSSLNKIKL